MKLFAPVLLIVLIAFTAIAQVQTAVPTTAEPNPAPNSYSIAAGVGFSRTSNPMVIGWGQFSYCMSGICPYTTWTNITGKEATIVAGIRKDLTTQGPLTLFLLGDMGAATRATAETTPTGTTVGSNLGAVFAAGGGVDFDLSTVSKRLQHMYATVSLQAQKVSIDTLHPAFSFGARYKFGQ